MKPAHSSLVLLLDEVWQWKIDSKAESEVFVSWDLIENTKKKPNKQEKSDDTLLNMLYNMRLLHVAAVYRTSELSEICRLIPSSVLKWETKWNEE